MLQNKLLFNQSSVRLEIFGLPDYSDNEHEDQISIISQWKLLIIDTPVIEGNIDHLRLIMEAFYSYTNFLVNNETALYESKLIDIKAENFFKHRILLKSSKPDVKPLIITIGNSVLSDIINCFDQLNSSAKIRKIKFYPLKNISKRNNFNFSNKSKISNLVLPPILSLCSLFLVSSSFMFFYNLEQDNENNISLNDQNISNSANTLGRLL